MEDVSNAMQSALGNSPPSVDENFDTGINEQATRDDEVVFFVSFSFPKITLMLFTNSHLCYLFTFSYLLGQVNTPCIST